MSTFEKTTMEELLKEEQKRYGVTEDDSQKVKVHIKPVVTSEILLKYIQEERTRLRESALSYASIIPSFIESSSHGDYSHINGARKNIIKETAQQNAALEKSENINARDDDTFIIKNGVIEESDDPDHKTLDDASFSSSASSSPSSNSTLTATSSVLHRCNSDVNYLNRSHNFAIEFSLLEIFHSLDDDNDGYLSLDTDILIAFKLFGVIDEYHQISSNEIIKTELKENQKNIKNSKIDQKSFCKIMNQITRRLDIEKRKIALNNSPVTFQSTFSSSCEPDIDVFLGGSCNPTVWRKQIAIPWLTSSNISYFNPQVEEWTSDLIKVEARAKARAKLLFFVVGPETRGIASMIEVAELIALKRDIILVLQDIPLNDDSYARVYRQDEIKDINRGRAYLADVASRHSIEVFKDIPEALKSIPPYLIQLKRKNLKNTGKSASVR